MVIIFWGPLAFFGFLPDVDQQVQQVLATDDADNLVLLNHREQTLLAGYQFVPDLPQCGLRPHRGHRGAHVVPDRVVLEPVENPLLHDLPGNQSQNPGIFRHGHGIDAVAVEDELGAFQGDVRGDPFYRKAHDVLGPPQGPHLPVDDLFETFLHLRQGLVLDCRGGRIFMAAATHFAQDVPHVDFRQPTPTHHVDPVFHLGQGK
jgi:hypothetical protein